MLSSQLNMDRQEVSLKKTKTKTTKSASSPSPKLRMIDLQFRVNEELDDWTQRWIESLPSYRNANRKDKKANLKSAFSVIIANLCRNSTLDDEIWTEIPRGNRDYSAGLMNPHRLNTRAVVSILDDLEAFAAGLFIEKSGGNHNSETGQGGLVAV